MTKACPFPPSESTSATGPNSWLYLLERFDVGVVHLDHALHVVGMNDYARRSLPVGDKLPFGKIVTDFHPEAAKAKVKFLLGQAECPVNNAPPMAMMINIPERVLLIKVSRTADARNTPIGYVLVFYDITEVVAADDAQAGKGSAPVRRQLQKIPTVSGQKIEFVNAEDVLRLQSDGHYTRVITDHGNQFCNLSLGDLEGRLDPDNFMRVHRSHIVNLRAVSQLLRLDGRLLLRLLGDEAEVPVSRTSSPALMARLGITPTTMAR